jgi:hypothetical protein
MTQPIADYPRWDSPWAQVDSDTWRYRVVIGGASIDYDLSELAAVTGADVPEPTTTTTTTATTPGGSPSEPGDAVDPVGVEPEVAAVDARPRFTG